MKKISLLLVIILLCTTSISALTLDPSKPAEGEMFNGTIAGTNANYNGTDYVWDVKLYYYNGNSFVLVYNNNTPGLTHYKFPLKTGIVNMSTVPDTRGMIFRFIANYTNEPGVFLNVSKDITFNLNNNPPTINTSITEIITNEDVTNSSLNLTEVFVDQEHNPQTYTFTKSDDIDISTPGGVLTINPDKNYHGNSTLIVVAYDGLHTITKTFNISFTSVEDIPKLDQKFSNVTVLKNKPLTIELDEHFIDADGDNLSYINTAISGATLTYNNQDATITPTVDYVGNISLSFNATDGKNTTSGNTFIISFVNDFENETNLPPTITTFSPLTMPPVNVGDTINFMIGVTDPNNDAVTTTWYVNQQLESQGVNTFSYTFTSQQNYIITAEASDGILTTTKVWNINLETNLPPQPPQTSQTCGNGVVEAGETCSSCIQDVPCADGEKCVSGSCQQKESYFWLIIIIIVIILLITTGVIAWMVFKKRKQYAIDELEKHEFTSFKPTPKTKPPIIPSTPRKLTLEEAAGQRYAKEALARGMTKAQVREALLERGWNNEQIETVLKGI